MLDKIPQNEFNWNGKEKEKVSSSNSEVYNNPVGGLLYVSSVAAVDAGRLHTRCSSHSA